MFETIISILAGLILLAGVLKKSSLGERITSALMPFQGIIGLITLVVGILNFFNVIGIALIVAGLILAAEALAGIPEIGKELKSAGQALGGLGGLVGAVLLVLAVYRLM